MTMFYRFFFAISDQYQVRSNLLKSQHICLIGWWLQGFRFHEIFTHCYELIFIPIYFCNVSFYLLGERMVRDRGGDLGRRRRFNSGGQTVRRCCQLRTDSSRPVPGHADAVSHTRDQGTRHSGTVYRILNVDVQTFWKIQQASYLIAPDPFREELIQSATKDEGNHATLFLWSNSIV